jgi:NAD(P)-dependent dehydrogenase (short-subunit alcohol dehydrogenase family)
MLKSETPAETARRNRISGRGCVDASASLREAELIAAIALILRGCGFTIWNNRNRASRRLATRPWLFFGAPFVFALRHRRSEPMSLKDKIVVVTGGSRGLGLGLVEALVDQGARVSVVARSAPDLEAVSARLGVKTISADITDERAAKQILAEIRPDVLILNAGATPGMGPIDKLSWEDFTKPWDIDVRGGLYWLQAALNLPLAAGARVLVGSSGAAQQGSPLSGGYAGAKRMLWLMAKYSNGVAEQTGLGIRFQAIVPMQMIGGTGVGGEGSRTYARAAGIEPDAFLARFGAPMPPRLFGEHVVRILSDPEYDTALALGLKGDAGISVLEGKPA